VCTTLARQHVCGIVTSGKSRPCCCLLVVSCQVRDKQLPAQLIDCDRGPPLYDLGCDGGNFEGGILYIAENGVDTEADYPYLAKDGKCRRAWPLPVCTWLLGCLGCLGLAA